MVRKSCVTCQTFGCCWWNYIHKNPLEGCLWLECNLRPSIFVHWNCFDIIYKKGLDLFLAIYLPKHYHYPQLTIIWCICGLIFDVITLKKLSSLMVISLSLTPPWFSLEMHVFFVHYLEKLVNYSPLLRSIHCKTLCEKDKYVLNSLT